MPVTCGFHSIRSFDNPIFEIWTRKFVCFFLPCCNRDSDGCELLDWVDGWDRISLPLDQRAIVELAPLEEDQSSISIYFDHVSDPIQPSMLHLLNIFFFIYLVFKLTLMALYHTKNIFIIYLQSYYAGNIYAVFSSKDSEWGGDY